jgi:hypothetical protein
MTLLDEFGREIRPAFVDSRDADFVRNVPGVPEEMIREVERSQAFYEAMSGARLYDASGALVATGSPTKITGRPFRIPLRCE